MNKEDSGEVGQITQWMLRLQSGDESVVDGLFRAYFERLSRLGTSLLPERFRRVSDGEDLASVVLQQFISRAAAGHFSTLQSRHDVWRLLASRLRQRAQNEVRRRTTQRENEGRTRGESVFSFADSSGNAGLDCSPDDADDELLARLNLTLMDALQETPELIETAKRLLQGDTPEEAAVALSCSRATVYRRLGRIREIWSQ